jgi:hypothetical protein
MENRDQWLERMQAETTQRLEQVQEMQESLRDVVGSAQSSDGMVRAKAAPGGAPVELVLTEGALRRSPDDLSRVVL